MKKNKLLEIIKYNKKLQKRLNININNYIEYSQLYSSIEIEIKPVENKYGQFINILDEDKYYHIYFDNSNEEIKRNYLEENEKVKKIKIIIDYQVTSFKDLFIYCDCINSMFFKKFNRINITYMNCMFCKCFSLENLNLSNFKTDNVTDMGWMFSYCSSLKKLNLSNFITNNVVNMERMFKLCSSLKESNTPNFNTNNVTDMSYMFYNCLSLKELNLSNFSTHNVNNMNGMFSGFSDELKNKIREQNFSLKLI